MNWENHVTNDNIKEEAKIKANNKRHEEETSSMVWTCAQKK